MNRKCFVFAVLLCLFTALHSVAQSVTTTTTITTYAGGTRNNYGDGGPAATAQILGPNGLAMDSAGNLYIADVGHYLVRKVTPAGVISTVAGNGTQASTGDGGPATSASLNNPVSVAVDSNGNLYIVDRTSNVVRKVTSSGTISTFAGTGAAGFSGDGGPAAAATLNGPFNIAVDSSNNVYVSDNSNRRFRKITPSGTISTFAGTGVMGSTGNGGLATAATFINPGGIAFDSAGNTYLGDVSGQVIRKVSSTGTITAFAGSGTSGFLGDGGAATSARFSNPTGITLDSSGNVYVCDFNNSRVRKITTGGTISTVVGTGTTPAGGDGGLATLAQIQRCSGLVFDSAGNLFMSDQGNSNIRKVNTSGVISTIVWGYGGDGGQASSATLQTPTGLAIDSSGVLYIGEEETHHIRRVSAGGVISTFGGNGLPTNVPAGDNGQATATSFAEVGGLALDLNGNLLFADQFQHALRRISTSGVITTIAGNGTSGFAGDGGQASAAQLNDPTGVTVDSAGNIYIADSENYRVRKITPAGVISTFAGTGGAGSSGDGGAATSAQLAPVGLAFDSAGSLYISDPLNNNIRKIATNGTISTILGTGSSNSSVQLNEPWGIAFDSSGNLFIVDRGNRRVLRRSPTGTVITIAGSGTRGTGGDGGSGTLAQFDSPAGIAVSAAGEVYVGDFLAHNVRKITITQQGSFTVPSGGGTTTTSTGAGPTVVAGYGSIAPTNGSTTPSGLAIFGYRQNGVLVSEAGVPASTTVSSARIAANVGGSVNTGLAIANPSGTDATLTFYFTDANGNNFGAGSTTISAYNQVARFLDQAPFNGGSSINGTFTFTSTVPVAVIALRGLTNERGEFLITTLPVADLAATPSTSAFVFPHFADGGGWSSQVLLVNGSDNTLAGNVQFKDANGAALSVTIAGTTANTFNYSIPPRTSVRLQTSGGGSSTVSGFIRVTPTGGSAAPTGLGIFSFRVGGITVTEAGVPAATAGSAFRFYAETLGTFGTPGSIQTGLAIMNNSGSAATVTVTLTRFDGTSTGLTGTISVPASGQAPMFLNQVSGLSSLPATFQGVMRVSSSSSISVVGLRGRYNERGDFLITTTPVVDEAGATITASRFFPQVADSGGYTTQFIIFSGQAGQSATANMDLKSSSGGAMNIATQ